MTEYHKENTTYRIVPRGKLWFMQQHDQTKGTKTIDPWFDLGPGYKSRSDARSALYGRVPLKPKQAEPVEA